MLHDKRHIYVRSPLRISFVGGGTDLESFYMGGTPGHVVSSTIDLYVYTMIKDMFDANVRVHHAEIETESIASRITHQYSKVALEHAGLFRGTEVVITSDVMTTGSGLGASSAIMSSLISGCSTLNDQPVPKKKGLAELTYKLECEAGTVGGKQDQYATVFGGLNSITFSEKEIKVEKLAVSQSRLKALQDRMFLVFTNLARKSKTIQSNLGRNARQTKTKTWFDALRQLSQGFLEELTCEHCNLDKIGELLHEGWLLKKSTNGETTNPYIEQLYDLLRKQGVIGGKILGAGGGGFFLAYAKNAELKKQIKYALYPKFIAMDVAFTSKGTEVLWKNF